MLSLVCQNCKLNYQLSFFITSQSKEALKEIEHTISCVSFGLVERNSYLVNFKGELWPGQLIKLTKSGGIVRCLQKTAVVGTIWI